MADIAAADKVQEYVQSFVNEPSEFRKVREESDAHREAHGRDCTCYPSSPLMGKILQLLVRVLSAGRVLELGTGLGYSTLWIAKALEVGAIVETIESDRQHAQLARKNFETQGFSKKARVLEGDAKRILYSLKGPYDLIFDDCTYSGKPEYYEEFPRLVRKNGILWTANFGGLQDWIRERREPWVMGMQEYAIHLRKDQRFETVILPYLWDGVSVRV